jgi:hypothetical protein
MGKIAEALRANLRQLAQADARMLRELDEALPAVAEPQPGAAKALADGLEALTLPNLRALCKQRELKGCSGLNKAALIQRLRGNGGMPAAKPAAKAAPKEPAAAKTVAVAPGLAALEARLDRMEALLQRIAERVGVGESGTTAQSG